jgi:hypothetical protein
MTPPNDDHEDIDTLLATADTVRVPIVRDWRAVSAELEREVAAMFDAAGTLPPASIVKLLAELGAMRRRA